MAKISVIGAGIGGMSAAARLAKNGHEVTIFENSERSGGKCRTEWFGDFAFDTGPSLLTLPAVYRDLFLKTGKSERFNESAQWHSVLKAIRHALCEAVHDACKC